MRVLHLAALGATCFLASAALIQDSNLDRGWRNGFDDWSTFRALDTEYWDALANVEMTLEEAIELARTHFKEDRKFDEVRVRSAQVVPFPTPRFELEVFGVKEEKQRTTRWHVEIGIKSGKIRQAVLMEPFPGVAIRGGTLLTQENGSRVFDIRVGDGALVEEDSVVEVHYKMYTLQDKVFDTYELRSPQTFKVGTRPRRAWPPG